MMKKVDLRKDHKGFHQLIVVLVLVAVLGLSVGVFTVVRSRTEDKPVNVKPQPTQDSLSPDQEMVIKQLSKNFQDAPIGLQKLSADRLINLVGADGTYVDEDGAEYKCTIELMKMSKSRYALYGLECATDKRIRSPDDYKIPGPIGLFYAIESNGLWNEDFFSAQNIPTCEEARENRYVKDIAPRCTDSQGIPIDNTFTGN